MDITELQKLCTKDDAAELTVAYNGRIKAMQAYQQAPGKAAKEDLQAATELFNQVVARLMSKYLPDQAPAPEGERFVNRKQAYDWLVAQGYKVSRGKFYNDCAAGFPRIHRDKTISRFEVLQYAQQLDVSRRSDVDLTDLARQREDAETRKAIADAKKAEIQAAELQRQLDKKWMLREEAQLEACAWASLLRDSVAYRLGQAVPAIIHAAGGQLDHTADVQAVIDQAIIDACNDIASSGEVEVELVDEEEALWWRLAQLRKAAEEPK